MSGKIVAVYSLKGGVGKTTLAVNLAWASAVLSGRKTLLWDLDGQAAATFILGHDGDGTQAEAAIRKDLDPRKLVRQTAIPGLDLLPADASLRDLDVIFRDLDKKKRLAKIADDLARHYDCVVIDCPPGLTDTSDQILRAADLVVVPVIPSALSHRALATITAHVADRKGLGAALLPVFSLVDRRRSLHREALAAEPAWPVIPMASAFEAMTERRAPLGALLGRKSPGVQAVAQVWSAIEQVLAAAT
ncbi:MAG: ParA family protein [Sphingomonadales bacterium]|nr:ParA family protein [Sphingomonadales bacterium]MBU3993785.1 ParA family protein [Alphaproteobacteria bacterium]